ncbi:MAG: cupin domain-containing protein [Thaumarchaeota archaeon]|nr:cupin domain-containing protein [Nitrososphaerota archaeon]
MAKMRKKNLDSPDETRKLSKGKFEVVTIGGVTVGRGTFQPGWKWSKSVKPIVKTDSCQGNHVGYVVSGKLKVHMDDGSEGEVGQGEAVHIPPGHDAWVVGKEPFVFLEVLSAKDYAKPAKKPSSREP